MAAPFFRFIGPPFRPGDGAKECDAEIQPRSERYWGRERQYQCPYPGRLHGSAKGPSLASEGVRAVGRKEATTTGSSLDWERRPTPERLKSLRRRLIEKHACGRAQF